MSKKFSVVAKNGMVASSQPLATLAGVQILMNGGNAIDAAIATAAVLGVVEASSLGIGSDAFCLFYLAKEKKKKQRPPPPPAEPRAGGASTSAARLVSKRCRSGGFTRLPYPAPSRVGR